MQVRFRNALWGRNDVQENVWRLQIVKENERQNEKKNCIVKNIIRLIGEIDKKNLLYSSELCFINTKIGSII